MPSDPATIQALLQRGDDARAEAACRTALAANPFDAAALDGLGIVARRRGDLAKAAELFANAIAFDGANALYRTHHALALRAQGKRAEARRAFEAALAADPDSFEAAYNFALLLREAGETDAALEMNRRAAALMPGSAVAQNNLGATLQALGRFEEAAMAYEAAIAADPNHVNAHANLANVLTESDRIDEARRLAERAIARWPRNPDVLNARVTALLRCNDLAGAVAAADAVAAVAPDYAQAHYAKGMALLAQGKFAEGWAAYEWRVRRAGFRPHRRYTRPRWAGDAMAGRTLLVHWEQGYGDVIQFCRYLPILRTHLDALGGGRIVFDCPAKLIGLMESVGGFDAIGDFGDDPPPFDAYVPLMSLPGILGTTAETIPAPIPYLRAPEVDPLPDDGTLKVGLTWASEHGESYRRKVCALDDLAPLLDVAGCRFYGLQFGTDGAALDAYAGRANVENLGDRLGDFAHTAGIVAAMDLIVSIDTYIVHLAGALGTPAWVLLPYSPDWRWQLGRADSPWYPTLRLFRQPAPGDWAGMIAEVADALAQRAREPGRSDV